MAKKEKAKKVMPEGYIGRPKPMKTKSFQFHKPTAKFWVGFGIFIAFAAFITYIIIRLINVGKVVDQSIDFYTYDEKTQSESYVLENDKIKFELDPRTTAFTITQKSNGHVWYSNPQNIEKDTIALGKEKNNLRSTFLIKYSTENGVNEVYDTYSNSVKRDFYEVKKSANTVSVNYTVGQMEREYYYPLAIYESDMDLYLEQMSSSDKNVITKRCYRLVDIDNLRASDNEEELLQKYPGLKDDNIYLIFNPLATYLKENCEKIFSKVGYTYEEYVEHRAIYKEVNIKDEPAFNLTVNYSLDKNNLIVDIPFEKIVYKHSYPIVQLSVLPYFGAAGLEDKGFMLVPEGGGSLINFNNGKTRQNSYYADLYGWDYATDRKALITETRAAFPVFGVAYEDAGFISIIDKGAAYAGVSADISGKLSCYNYVRADYKMVHGEQYEVSVRNTSAQYAYEKNLPVGESIKQIYSFVDTGSYVDMAKSYRDYLFKDANKVNNTDVPVAIEIIGAIDKMQQVAGMPKIRPYKLTSYKEAGEIVNDIEAQGIKNVNYKFSGFINGGIKQQFLKNKVSFIKELGGKSAFKKMLNSTKNSSGKFFLDATTQFAYRSKNKKGFNRFKDPARFVSSEVCELSEYSPIWYGKLDNVDTYYLVNSKNISKASNALIKTGQKYKLNGVSFHDAGYLLSADYNDNHPCSRNQAMEAQIQKFKMAQEKNLEVMVNAGNDYSLKNSDFVTNMVLRGNQYAILDKQIPFYQIALHGYVNFASEPINLSYEAEQLILESAESGAGLSFLFMKESERAIQETNYTEYFAACYEDWKDNMNEIYSKYNKDFAKVSNSVITDHKYEADAVSVTTFDNNYKVYVNFGYTDYTNASGIVIPAREYKLLQVEE